MHDFAISKRLPHKALLFFFFFKFQLFTFLTTYVILFFGSPTGEGGELYSDFLYQKWLFPPVMQTILLAFIIFPEFVEVILLPLDEFQQKIDGEVPSQRDVSVCNKRSDGTRCPTCALFSVSPQSYWKKKKSWWILRCTSSPWGWCRPSSSRGSCLSWSSDGGWRGETVYAVTQGSWRVREALGRKDLGKPCGFQ